MVNRKRAAFPTLASALEHDGGGDASTSLTQNSSPKKKILKMENNSDSNSHNEEELEQNGSKKINWKRFSEFLKFITECVERNPEYKKRRGNCNLELLLTDEERKKWPDLDVMQSSFRTYYTKAAALSKVTVNFAAKRVEDFMNEEMFVTQHPNFPKQNISAHTILCQKLKLGIGATSQAARLQDLNDPLARQAIHEAEMDKERYYNELGAFLEKHQEEILPAHRAYVEKKLSKHNKDLQKVNNSTTTKTPNSKKSPSKPLTAFDYYKQSKRHKFLELGAEEREAKLLRHFNRLDDDKRLIFEDLASNMQ